MDKLEGLALGAVGGAAAAISGYLKTTVGQQNPEEFNLLKASLTILLGAAFGAVAANQGLLTDPLSLAGGSAGLATVVENLSKAILRGYAAWKAKK